MVIDDFNGNVDDIHTYHPLTPSAYDNTIKYSRRGSGSRESEGRTERSKMDSQQVVV